MMVLWIVLLLGALVAAFMALSGQPELLASLGDVDTAGWIAAAVLLLYVVYLLLGHGGRLGEALRHVAIWTALFLAAIVGYAYRDEVSLVVNRVAGDLLPPGTGITWRSRRVCPASARCASASI